MAVLIHFLWEHQELEQKVEYWMEKYDKDVEAKQHELDVLKASKAKDLERLQELTKLVRGKFFTFSVGTTCLICKQNSVSLRTSPAFYFSCPSVRRVRAGGGGGPGG